MGDYMKRDFRLTREERRKKGRRRMAVLTLVLFVFLLLLGLAVPTMAQAPGPEGPAWSRPVEVLDLKDHAGRTH